MASWVRLRSAQSAEIGEQVLERRIAQPARVEDRHQRLCAARKLTELSFLERAQRAIDRHDLERERVLTLHDAFDAIAAATQRDGAEAQRDDRARIADRRRQRLPRTRGADRREVRAQRAALPTHLVATGAVVDEQRAAAIGIARRLEPRHHTDAAQMRDDGPDLVVGRGARRHAAARHTPADDIEGALVALAARPAPREIGAEPALGVGAVAVGTPRREQLRARTDGHLVALERIALLRVRDRVKAGKNQHRRRCVLHALALSSSAMSSALSTSSSAPMSSVICATDVALAIGAAMAGFAMTHASATCAHVAPCRAATASSAASTALPLPSRCFTAPPPRTLFVLSEAVRYLPVKKPLASG